MNGLMRVVLLLPAMLGSLAEAACVTPIADPAKADRKAWDDLLTITVAPDLNPVISQVQDYQSTGDGPLSLDYYSISFDGGGRKPSQWMNDFRVNIDKRIFNGTAFAVKPHDAANAERWSSSAPKGAVMVFDLAPPPERGAVVVSCHDASSFVFTSVQIDGAQAPGEHPLSSHRGFAFVANDDGSVTFFSKGVERRKAGNAGFERQGSERLFAHSAAVWTRVLGNLKEVNKRKNPRAEVTHRRSEEP